MKAGTKGNGTTATGASFKATDMLAIGHLQSLNFTQQKATQPVMAIGSGRSFYVSGKAQGQASLGRLFVNGRNLMRVLMHNMRRSDGPDITKFDEKPAHTKDATFLINLDSEMYLIPIGLGVLFRDKVHHTLGSFYAELTMITSYAISATAGQNMIMESTSLLFDRLCPFIPEVGGQGDYAGMTDTAMAAVIGFIDNTITNAQKTGSGSAQAQPKAG